MVLHTIIDPAEVMMETGSLPEYEYLNKNGCILQCVRREDGLYLDRIISTDLRDYLNASYQLGKRLGK